MRDMVSRLRILASPLASVCDRSAWIGATRNAYASMGNSINAHEWHLPRGGSEREAEDRVAAAPWAGHVYSVASPTFTSDAGVRMRVIHVHNSRSFNILTIVAGVRMIVG